LKFRRERRPTSLALAAERNESLLPRLGFRAGGEHSGRGMRRARAGCAAIKDLDRSATSRQPPSDTKPDDASANNDNLRLAEVPETIVQPVAPFAGMTQTGSTGVISAATGAAPLAVSIRRMGIFARFYKHQKKRNQRKSRRERPFQVDFRQTNLMLQASPREADSTAPARLFRFNRRWSCRRS
jgi:hypothetical protein